MDKTKSDNQNQQIDGLSKEKTNQEDTKQKQSASLPNQTKNHQVGEEESEENKPGEVRAKIGSQTQSAHDGHNTHDAQNVKDGAIHNKEQADRKSSNHNSGMPDRVIIRKDCTKKKRFV